MSLPDTEDISNADLNLYSGFVRKKYMHMCNYTVYIRSQSIVIVLGTKLVQWLLPQSY
jgi:hypothetical protein